LIVVLDNIDFVNLHFPDSQELKSILLYYCNSLNITDESEIKVFINLFVMSKYGKGLSIEEASDEQSISIKEARRILEKFMKLGLSRISRERYLFRENTMSMTLDAILDDIFVISRNLKRASILIDRKATKNAVEKLLESWEDF